MLNTKVCLSTSINYSINIFSDELRMLYTCVSSFVRNIDTISTPTGSMLSTKASQGWIAGKAVIMAPIISRKMVPGVNNDDTKRKMW